MFRSRKSDKKTWLSRKSGLVWIFSLGTLFGPSAHDDLLLRRNLLIFCPYILVLKWKKIEEIPLCLSHFFHFLREKKKRTREKTNVEVRRWRYFVAHSSDRKSGKGEIQANTIVCASFSFCNVNAPANFSPWSILWIWSIHNPTRIFRFKNSDAVYHSLSKLWKRTLDGA